MRAVQPSLEEGGGGGGEQEWQEVGLASSNIHANAYDYPLSARYCSIRMVFMEPCQGHLMLTVQPT